MFDASKNNIPCKKKNKQNKIKQDKNAGTQCLFEATPTIFVILELQPWKI